MSPTDLRGSLLGAEPPSPELERRYHERLAALFVRRQTGAQRASALGVLAISLWLVFRFIQLYVRQGHDARLVTLVGLGVGLAFSVGMVALSLWLLRGGVEDFRRHGLLRTALVALFTFALALLMLWAGLEAPDREQGTHLILFGLVFWTTIGLPFYLTHLVRQSELRLRVDLLRAELERSRAAARAEARP